ncbi:MAG: hypothetical protein ABIT04_13600 [Novosphingobium sp.]
MANAEWLGADSDRLRKIAVVLCWIALGAALAACLLRADNHQLAANYAIVFAIGLAVGATEMMARYTDAPFRPLLSWPGLFYFVLNAGAAILAYYLIVELDAAPAGKTSAEKAITQVLFAGLGAMAFFRSGLFTVPIGGTDVAIGPNLVLQIVLHALDRAYDRERAKPRSREVSAIMGGVSFESARSALPMICFSLMQNISDDERAEFGRQVDAIAASTDANDEAKVLTLGLELMNLVGEGTLKCAINVLGPAVQGFQALDTNRLLQLAKIQTSNAIASLPVVCNEIAHRSLRIADPLQLVAVLNQLAIAEASKSLLIVYKLVNQYGLPTVDAAMDALAPVSSSRNVVAPVELPEAAPLALGPGSGPQEQVAGKAPPHD